MIGKRYRILVVKGLSTKQILIFFAILSVLSFLTLGRILNFHFWRDDWDRLWAANYSLNTSLANWAFSPDHHPGSTFEQMVGVKIFGFNPLYWQVFAIFLRVLNSSAVALMMYGITKSKKAAALAGIFFAVFAGGVESYTWVSAHTSALIIFFFCLTVYFWVTRSKFSIPFLIITLAISPGRAFFAPFFLLIWDLGLFWRSSTKRIDKSFLARILSLILIILVVYVFLKMRFGYGLSFPAIFNPISLERMFSSLGNLFIGWALPINEVASTVAFGALPAYMKVFSIAALVLGMFYFVYAATNLINFIFKKDLKSHIYIFFLSIIGLSYIPNWFFDTTLEVAISHRYLAVSSVGFVCLVAYALSRNKNLATSFFMVFFVVANILTSNRILKSQYPYRSFELVESLWNKIDKDVPKDQKLYLFIYQGEGMGRRMLLDWSGPGAFAIKRNINDIDYLPVVTDDRPLIASLVCDETAQRPTAGGWRVRKEKIRVENIYSWNYENGKLVNTSIATREELKSICSI